MTDEEIDRKLELEPDFINIKRFDYSLAKLLERYPDGPPDHIIAAALNMSEKEYKKTYTNLLVKLRTIIGVE